MKDTVQQRDLYRTYYLAIFIRDTTKNIAARGFPRQTGTRPPARHGAVSRFSQCITITPFLETT